MKCDFCSSPNPAWKYSCEDFVLEGTEIGSAGAWAACDECAALIERNDREGLAKRCLETFPLLDYVPRRIARKTLEKIHKHFFKNRDASVERL